MLGLIESLTAICAIVITCRIAGRIPAMMITAVAAATAAVVMPPFASWEVESTTDILTVIFQSIVGLAVVYRWQPRFQAAPRVISRVFARPEETTVSLLKTVQAIVKRDAHPAAKLHRIDVCDEVHEGVAISQRELEQ